METENWSNVALILFAGESVWLHSINNGNSFD